MLLAPLFDFVLAGVDDAESARPPACSTPPQQLSGAIGIAAIGTVFFSVLASHDIQRRARDRAVDRRRLVVVTGALAFLLPMRAREDAAHA